MDTENQSPSQDAAQEEDFDALYDSIVNPKDESALDASTENAPAIAAKTPIATQAPIDPEHEYTWSGQKIKAPLSEILRKAGMGHDYSQKMEAFNKERQGWQEKLSLSQKLNEQYGPVDEWVRGNPDKWEKLQAVIQAEKAGHGDLDTNHPLYQKYQELQKTLNEKILPTIEAQEQEKTRLKYEAEDKTLISEIQSIREKYKDLDWATVDESGRSALERKVCLHASENGFKTFRAAFLDLNHDDLMKRAEERGKGSIANDRARAAKTGLLGQTSAPTQGLRAATNIKNKSYDELAREGLEEYGIR